jgi:hypothetical protein
MEYIPHTTRDAVRTPAAWQAPGVDRARDARWVPIEDQVDDGASAGSDAPGAVPALAPPPAPVSGWRGWFR